MTRRRLVFLAAVPAALAGLVDGLRMLAIRPLLAVLLVIGSMTVSLYVAAEVFEASLATTSESQEPSGVPEDPAQSNSPIKM